MLDLDGNVKIILSDCFWFFFKQGNWDLQWWSDFICWFIYHKLWSQIHLKFDFKRSIYYLGNFRKAIWLSLFLHVQDKDGYSAIIIIIIITYYFSRHYRVMVNGTCSGARLLGFNTQINYSHTVRTQTSCLISPVPSSVKWNMSINIYIVLNEKNK